MDRGPIYIAGIERSGTTLLYALLASHPNIAMTNRTQLWTYFNNRYGDLSRREHFERCLSVMMRYKRLLALQPDPERIRREFWQGEPTYARLFSLIHQHYAERLGKSRWGDKSLNTERYVDDILAAFPSAKVIHMIRDPRDRYASSRISWQDTKRIKVGVETAIWLYSVRLAKAYQKRYPDRYKIVRYEILAAEPEQTLREICIFMGEKYSPAMLNMEGAKDFRDKGGNSSYGEREVCRISTSSIGRFRQAMSKRELASMQGQAKWEMLACGYELDPVELSPREWLSFYSVDWPTNLALMAYFRVRETILNKTGRTLPAHRIVPNPASLREQGITDQ